MKCAHRFATGLLFAVQDECGQDFIFTRHDVGTASWAGEVPVLPFGEAQPAVADVQRFEVVCNQHTLNRDVLLQSAAWAGQELEAICKEPERRGMCVQFVQSFAQLRKISTESAICAHALDVCRLGNRMTFHRSNSAPRIRSHSLRSR